jgi:MFS family permease
MISLGLVLRVVQSGGSYALAGTVTGAFAVLAGLTAPPLARLVDQRGQTALLFPTAVATLAASALLGTLPRSAPPFALIGAAALLGAAWPPIGSSTSALLTTLSADEPTKQSAFALDAVLGEASFIVGPLLVVLVAGLANASAAIVFAGSLICASTLGIATSKPSREAIGSRLFSISRRTRLNAALSPGVIVLLSTALLMFVGFSATEVGVIAAARHTSGNGAAGALLAVWSVGSVLGGVIYGARTWPGTLTARLTMTLGASAALTVLMLPLHAPILLGFALIASGIICAPGLSMVYTALSDVAVVGTVTEAFAWLASMTTLGSAIGATAAGTMITRHGVGAAFAAACIAFALSSVVVLVRASTASRPQPESIASAET